MKRLILHFGNNGFKSFSNDVTHSGIDKGWGMLAYCSWMMFYLNFNMLRSRDKCNKIGTTNDEFKFVSSHVIIA